VQQPAEAVRKTAKAARLPSADLAALLGPALRAAARAGQEILSVYSGDFAVDSKEDRTPITEADRRAHGAISEVLAGAAVYPILSEEGRLPPFRERRRWRRFWMVDPLDGTKEFVKRNGEFTVNIALIEGHRPVLGVVYAPVSGLLYFAARGQGAGKTAMPPAGHAGPGLEQAAELALDKAVPLPRRASTFPGRIPARRQRRPLTVMASRSHSSRRWQRYLEKLERVYGEVEVLTLGSALKSCLVAEGRADLYLRFGTTMEWDTAAAQAVLEAVGRRMRSYSTHRRLRYNKRSLINPAFLAC
jgi:3'(2'), 5'-bisphosphate nucleotidase